jgi:hypothetical protein
MDFDIELAEVSGYSDDGELYGSAPNGWITVSQQLEPIAVDPTAVTAKDPLDWYPVTEPLELLVDKNPDGTYTWDGTDGAYNNGNSNQPYEVYMDLGEKDVADAFSVGGLLLSGRGDHPPEMDVFTGDESNWASSSSARIEMASGDGEFISVLFDHSLQTSHIMFRMDANESWLLHKAVPLKVTPEPATAALFLASLTLLTRLRPRRRARA